MREAICVTAPMRGKKASIHIMTKSLHMRRLHGSPVKGLLAVLDGKGNSGKNTKSKSTAG